MKKLTQFIFLSFLILAFVSGCASKPTDSSKVSNQPSGTNVTSMAPQEPEKEQLESPEKDSQNTPTLPPETPEEPIDVESLSFFQENQNQTITDPLVLQAQSAKTVEECENYQGYLAEICYQSTGLSPNKNSSMEEVIEGS